MDQVAPLTTTREQRGLAIAARAKIAKTGEFWIVPSQSNNGKYVVHYRDGNDTPHCSCPDHETTGGKCKHIYAVEIVTLREQNPDGSVTVTEAIRTTEVVKRKYTQNWPAYNAAQINEKDRFQILLRDLCRGLPDPPCKRPGRPRLPLADAMFAAVFKVYSTLSGRRFMTDLRGAHAQGHIGKLPCHDSIFKVFENTATTPILIQLVQATAAPLKAFESGFACDSSGFSACRFDRWYDHKYGGEKSRRTWVKCHLMCGVKTNVVTAVEISQAGDSPTLPGLLSTTRRTFGVNEVYADLAYSSKENVQVIADAGAAPLIPFKSNAAGLGGGLWTKMFHYFQFNRDEFLARYHQRSNVESTFSMVKAKFGDSVRSKTDTAMANEVLAKIVCHNICCLISAIYELGIDPVFWAADAG